MASGYVRQAAANIASKLPINAEDFNAEYNQLQTAFDVTLGHDHSGATGTGAKVPLNAGVVGQLPLANGGLAIDASISAVTLPKGLNITSGGITVSAGGLGVTSGGITVQNGGINVVSGGLSDNGHRVFSVSNLVPAVVFTPANPTGTSSASLKMMGLGNAFPGVVMTPTTTGRIYHVVTGIISAPASTTTGSIQFRMGVGTPPNNGDAAVGVSYNAPITFAFQNAATVQQPFTLPGLQVSASLNTQYWLDIALASDGTRTITVQNLTIIAFEI